MKITDETLAQFHELEKTRKRRVGIPPMPSQKAVVTRVEKIDPGNSIIPWGFLQTDSTMIGAEKWDVAYVPTEQDVPAPDAPITQYRVNYYTAMQGDFFYSDVVPYSFSYGTARDWLITKLKNHYEMHYAPRDLSVNEIRLTGPPK